MAATAHVVRAPIPSTLSREGPRPPTHLLPFANAFPRIPSGVLTPPKSRADGKGSRYPPSAPCRNAHHTASSTPDTHVGPQPLPSPSPLAARARSRPSTTAAVALMLARSNAVSSCHSGGGTVATPSLAPVAWYAGANAAAAAVKEGDALPSTTMRIIRAGCAAHGTGSVAVSDSPGGALSSPTAAAPSATAAAANSRPSATASTCTGRDATVSAKYGAHAPLYKEASNAASNVPTSNGDVSGGAAARATPSKHAASANAGAGVLEPLKHVPMGAPKPHSMVPAGSVLCGAGGAACMPSPTTGAVPTSTATSVSGPPRAAETTSPAAPPACQCSCAG